MQKDITWTYNDKQFKVGNSLNDDWEPNNIFPIVWFKKRLYRAIIKPKTPPKISKVCLIDIYNPKLKCYWTTIDKVYNIIEL